MHIPPPSLIKSPDAGKSFAGLKQALPDGGTAFEPTSAIIDGVAAGNAIAGFLKMAGFWAVRGIILPAELLFRRQIGERYLSPIVILVSVCVVVLLKSVRLIDGIGQTILLVGIGLGLIIHGQIISRAQRKGIHWHSYSEGDSALQDPLYEELWRKQFGPFSTFSCSKTIGEPLTLIVLYAFAILADYLSTGLLIDMLNIPFAPRSKPWKFEFLSPHASYFLIAAVAMFGYQVYCWSVRRSQLLDALDAQVMVEAYKESMQSEENQGLRSCRGAAYIPAIKSPTWGSSALPSAGQ